jgi:Zn-dependent protease
VSRFDPYAPRDFDDEYQYSPIRQRTPFRELMGKLLAPILAFGLLLLKFGAVGIKFFGIFISVGGYALIWGWRFAVGFVLLILFHELGHYLEARRQGLKPSLPVFIPFLGAYVAMKEAPFDPWRNLLVSAAGPFAGGLASLAIWGIGEAQDSRLLIALAYAGFLLNLFNLIPVRPFDGGFIWRSVRALWIGRRQGAAWTSPVRAVAATLVYGGLIVTLALGMVATHLPQDRL